MNYTMLETGQWHFLIFEMDELPSVCRLLNQLFQEEEHKYAIDLSEAPRRFHIMFLNKSDLLQFVLAA